LILKIGTLHGQVDTIPRNRGEGQEALELKRFQQTLRHVLLLPIVACLVLAGVLTWQIRRANSTVNLFEQSDRRIALATQIEKLVIDEETGLRGYQITADKRFLQPYYDAEVPMQQAITGLQAVLKPEQQLLLTQFVNEHQAWHDGFAQPIISIIAAGGRADDDDTNLTGRAEMDDMRAEMEDIERTSEKTSVDRVAQWKRQTVNEVIVLIVSAMAVGLIIGLFTRDRLETISIAFGQSLELQRTRAEELFRSEQHLRTTLASIGDGVIACDPEGKVQMMNPVAQELTGWLESQAIGLPLDQVFPIVNEASRQPVENPVAKVKRLDRVVGVANHACLIRRDGSEIAIDHSGAPIRNEAGQLTGVVMVFRDVTMERRTRATLVANEKLAVAGRLAATIAHEIHNPLDSVGNLLYLLQNDPDDAEAKHFLKIAQSELARVTQISRAMLSLYRESKAPVPVNLKVMLEDLLLLMEGRFNSLGITVTTSLPSDITVEGFPAELRQVFTNLITNACEAAGEAGRVSIRVIPYPAMRNPPPGQRPEAGAIVEIVDTGPGIPADVRERLCQPFFTTKGERGTGLGLWVSQGIVRKHAGTLDLLSRTEGPDHGVTASVFLASKPIIDPGRD
jgi:PAS domain S-box-containing protein